MKESVPLFFILASAADAINGFTPTDRVSPSARLIARAYELRPAGCLLPAVKIVNVCSQYKIRRIVTTSRDPQMTVGILRCIPGAFLGHNQPVCAITFGARKNSSTCHLFIHLTRRGLAFKYQLRASRGIKLRIRCVTLGTTHLPLTPVRCSTYRQLITGRRTALIRIGRSQAVLFYGCIPRTPVRRTTTILLLPSSGFRQSLRCLCDRLHSNEFTIVRGGKTFKRLTITATLLQTYSGLINICAC